jgi:hypothetical protein
MRAVGKKKAEISETARMTSRDKKEIRISGKIRDSVQKRRGNREYRPCGDNQGAIRT